MTKFLQSIDRIEKEFKFTINKEETFTTSFGGIITILYYIGLISLFGFFGKELIIKEDPNFIQRVDIKDKNSVQVINDTNFFFAIAITDYNDHAIFNRSLFEVSLIYTTMNSEGFENTIIDPIDCSDKGSLN